MAKELIQRAIDRGASDIYLIASKEKYKLYFRQMTARVLVEEIGLEVGLALLTHFKFLAGMNTGERRRVQLGACWYELEESNAKRLRLSTVGDFEGNESLVIRLLHDQNKKLDFWFDEELENYDCKRGLHLFAGPVGSGKTSLMFDLARRHFTDLQVITIEEPVELIDSDFIQLQVNEVIGNSYDELIKLSLRHRPDLLIVGEIRDEFDEDERNLIQEVGEREYLIEGSMKLDDINDALELTGDLLLESEDYDSIGGIIIEQLDRLPEENETVELENGIHLKVAEMDKTRIDKVYMTLPPSEPEETETAADI